MQVAFDVFINGISGVFVGLGVLYVAIKLNKLLAGREVVKKEQ